MAVYAPVVMDGESGELDSVEATESRSRMRHVKRYVFSVWR